jgi:hypothetical protein
MRHPLFWGTIVAIVVANSLVLYGNKFHQLDIGLWLSVMGTVITALAFGFGTYFVTLAVDAYSQSLLLRQAKEALDSALSELAKAGEKLKQAQREASERSKHIEQEALHHVESVMAAIVEYVQQMPKTTDAQKKAAKQLQKEVTCIRARFICKNSNDSEDVNSAILLLANFKDRTSLESIAGAKVRFRENSELCTVADTAIKMMQMA